MRVRLSVARQVSEVSRPQVACRRRVAALWGFSSERRRPVRCVGGGGALVRVALLTRAVAVAVAAVSRRVRGAALALALPAKAAAPPAARAALPQRRRTTERHSSIDIALPVTTVSAARCSCQI